MTGQYGIADLGNDKYAYLDVCPNPVGTGEIVNACPKCGDYSPGCTFHVDCL